MAASRYVAGESEQAGRLHALAGQLAYHLDDETTAVEEFERAIAVAERLGDERTVATSRCYYGAVLLVNGEVERGAEMARLAAEAAARLAIYPLAAESLSVLAISHAVAGDFANEREMHVARLAVAREHGDVARTADALGTLAEVALDEADSAGARSFAEESLAIAEPTLPMEACVALAVLARADVVEGDLSSAVTTLRRAFAAAEKIGQRLMLAQCYRVAGAIAAARGSAAEAVRLYAAAQRLVPVPERDRRPGRGRSARRSRDRPVRARRGRRRARVDAGDLVARRPGQGPAARRHGRDPDGCRPISTPQLPTDDLACLSRHGGRGCA